MQGTVVRPGEAESVLESIECIDTALVHASPLSPSVLVILHLSDARMDQLAAPSSHEKEASRLERARDTAVARDDYLEAARCHEALCSIVEGATTEARPAESAAFSLDAASEELRCHLEQTAEYSQLVEQLEGASIQFMVTETKWTIGNGLMSGEMKKRRGVILEAYKDAIGKAFL